MMQPDLSDILATTVASSLDYLMRMLNRGAAAAFATNTIHFRTPINRYEIIISLFFQFVILFTSHAVIRKTTINIG